MRVARLFARFIFFFDVFVDDDVTIICTFNSRATPTARLLFDSFVYVFLSTDERAADDEKNIFGVHSDDFTSRVFPTSAFWNVHDSPFDHFE